MTTMSGAFGAPHPHQFGGFNTATSAASPQQAPQEAGPYAIIVRMGYQDLRFDVPIVVSEDTVFEIIRRKMGAPPAAKDAIEKLPNAKRSGLSSDSVDAWLCVVCQCQFEEEDELTLMPCRHAFHTACLLPWLQVRSIRAWCTLLICRFFFASQSECVRGTVTSKAKFMRFSVQIYKRCQKVGIGVR